MKLPALPAHPDGLHWEDNVHTAYEKIRTSVDKAATLLRQDDGDPARLHAMLARLEDTCVPLIEELEKVLGSRRWSNRVIKVLGRVMERLASAAKASQDRCVAFVATLRPNTKIGLGKPVPIPLKTLSPSSARASVDAHASASIKRGSRRPSPQG